MLFAETETFIADEVQLARHDQGTDNKGGRHNKLPDDQPVSQKGSSSPPPNHSSLNNFYRLKRREVKGRVATGKESNKKDDACEDEQIVRGHQQIKTQITTDHGIETRE